MTTSARQSFAPVAIPRPQLAPRAGAAHAELTKYADALSTRARRTEWRARYTAAVRITDTAVIIGAVMLAQAVRFGVSDPLAPIGPAAIPALALSAVVAVTWKICLRLSHADDTRVLGAGSTEYNRVLVATLAMIAALAITSMATNTVLPRGYWAIAVSSGISALLVSRLLWRRQIAAGRRSGRYRTEVLVAGTATSVIDLVAFLDAHPDLGYHVTGACLDGTTPHHGPLIIGNRDIPVLGDLRSASVHLIGPSAIALTSIDAMGHDSLRELSWHFDALGIEVLVAPGMLADTGPRLTMRSDPGLPLLHIDKPRYYRSTKALKRAFDVSLATLNVIALAPLLLACALAIKLDDGGPIFYRAERNGLNNKPFRMWKFRSMVPDADAMRGDLATSSDGNGVLFKMRSDPRVTRVGRFIRRYSLDELPQLFNVIGGSMSLVGPRPPLAEEVCAYDHMVNNRMRVRPGMTGLWQVSGRSDLSWDESVHLDLVYIENWTLAGDVAILLRTFRAVLGKAGAY